MIEAVFVCTGKKKRPNEPWNATFELDSQNQYQTPFLDWNGMYRQTSFSVQSTDELFVIGTRYRLMLIEKAEALV